MQNLKYSFTYFLLIFLKIQIIRSDSKLVFEIYLKFVYISCRKKKVKQDKDYFNHLVVLTSTVLPGDTENVVIPALEKYSGLKHGKDFGVCYSPEFIAIGSVIEDFLNPDFIFDSIAGIPKNIEQIKEKINSN